jgi:hypothetical protein
LRDPTYANSLPGPDDPAVEQRLREFLQRLAADAGSDRCRR